MCVFPFYNLCPWRFFPLTHVKNNPPFKNSFGCFHSGILHCLIVHSSVNTFIWPARNEDTSAGEVRCLERVIFGGIWIYLISSERRERFRLFPVTSVSGLTPACWWTGTVWLFTWKTTSCNLEKMNYLLLITPQLLGLCGLYYDADKLKCHCIM